jgi:hypothetical protein
MIIPTMNEAEICNDLKKDMSSVVSFSDKKDTKVRRAVITSSHFPVYLYSFYTSPRKNRWLLCWESRNKKEFGENIRLTLICIIPYDQRGRKMAIMLTSTVGIHHFVFFPPHFFERYAERTNKKLTGESLIREYFTFNASYVYTTKEARILNSNIACTEFFGSSKEGVAMGIETSEKNIFFKTFITYDITKGEQIEKFAENEKFREEIHEKDTGNM